MLLCGDTWLIQNGDSVVIVPKVIKQNVEKIFEAYVEMDQSELNHTLICVDAGEEFYLRKDLKVRAFRTYNVITGQGYIIYSVSRNLNRNMLGYLVMILRS